MLLALVMIVLGPNFWISHHELADHMSQGFRVQRADEAQGDRRAAVDLYTQTWYRSA